MHEYKPWIAGLPGFQFDSHGQFSGWQQKEIGVKDQATGYTSSTAASFLLP